MMKCVGFISRVQEPLVYQGTVFVVGVPYPRDPSTGVMHLVTAKHVAIGIGNGDFTIAFNGTDGLPMFSRPQGNNRWFYHATESDSVDVAVMPFSTARMDEYDVTPIPVGMFATDERIAQYEIGIGDEIVNVGLFTPFFGTSHLIPILRTGNIAMMPKDKVLVRNFGYVDAYLAEGRSIGGLSGSPVFCRNTVKMPAIGPHQETAYITGLGGTHFLGLMHGHWDIPMETPEAVKQIVNMGISIIIPAKKILEVLNNPELVKLREEAFQRPQPSK
jgi:hypothetical protein